MSVALARHLGAEEPTPPKEKPQEAPEYRGYSFDHDPCPPRFDLINGEWVQHTPWLLVAVESQDRPITVMNTRWIRAKYEGKHGTHPETGEPCLIILPRENPQIPEGFRLREGVG